MLSEDSGHSLYGPVGWGISQVLCMCCVTPRVLHTYREETSRVSVGEMTAVAGPSSPAVSQVETPKSPFANGNGRLESITQLHAAAVNGDKPTLTRLVAACPQELDAGDQFGRSPLMFCVLADRLECAETLLKAGAQINLRDKGGRTALHWAAHKGNYRLMKMLVSKGADCREKDNEGQTALHLCTRHKLPKCMALLLRQLTPGEMDDQDNNKRTALHWAASYGNLEHVKMLIKWDSNIGIPDTDGKTPLHWAASSRDRQAVSCVKLILETTPSVINWQDYEGRTALHLAVADGNESIVNVLVQTSIRKCNVSALDNWFRTPLHWAAVLGHSKIVGFLLDSGADFASSDSNGATPLHYAAQNNYDDTVEVFLSHKLVTDESDVDGRTAFMWAAGKGADDVIRIFIKHCVDIRQMDKHEETALHAAAYSGHTSTVRILLEYRADIDAVDLMKHTPLFRACESGQTDVVQTLIDAGAKVDVVDQDGRSPLHWAALGGHAYICQTLIKFGVDPNIRDTTGRTPIQCAAYGGFVNCMSVLMEHKADPSTQDNEGMTSLHWACSMGHLDTVKLLVEHMAYVNHMEFTEDRYTPLDYALMGEHHDVAQYMIEQGALSITGIQDIAAQKIQSAFRGYRVRKTFIERKRLLMKHEKLKREAARKRAVEEYRKKEDVQHKRDVEDKYVTSDLVTMETAGTVDTAPAVEIKSGTKKKKEYMPTEREIILSQKKEAQSKKQAEHERQKAIRRKQQAAVIIQTAWRRYRKRSTKLTNQFASTARGAVRRRRLRTTEEEWERQIAALTIQLAWRKFFRKKLLRQIHPNKRQLQMWDPDVIAAKQRALVNQIYTEAIQAPFWHPTLKRQVRPFWHRLIPSPAALSYNFAVDQYHPDTAMRGVTPQVPPDDHTHSFPSSRNALEEELSESLQNMKVTKGSQPARFSYNLNDLKL
ncbi:LOW QUALITY PROTEIN: inversin-like [Haliotis rubra]|uniref:LOW QUALITY PROTEIN: inversin-like n=1 Tax=Haliotis rubra TaxID=36100 RepID=UPI001EE55063|nr:LOW QUALITY PROTEIN: inversin-like [Haliotis rubra]